MKKITLILVFIICACFVLLGQQTQSTEDPFSYQVSGLVYVKDFDVANRAKLSTQKIPKKPLKFEIVSTEIDATDQSTFYIIKFLQIIEEVEGVAILKNSAVFVNSGDNNKFFWLRKDEFDNYISNSYIAKSYKTPNGKLTYGANLSLPFKLRQETSGQNIKITPDLTLGGYLGVKWRLSPTEPFYLSFPVVTLGLATLSINDNNNLTIPNKGDGTVLGITGSWGGIFQLKDFQFGLMMGWDRAAGEIGKDWIYNNKTWLSFSIGYSFLGNAPDKEEKKKGK